jgi:hypothetical protein
MSSTLLLPPRAQLCNRSCSNKTHTSNPPAGNRTRCGGSAGHRARPGRGWRRPGRRAAGRRPRARRLPAGELPWSAACAPAVAARPPAAPAGHTAWSPPAMQRGRRPAMQRGRRGRQDIIMMSFICSAIIVFTQRNFFSKKTCFFLDFLPRSLSFPVRREDFLLVCWFAVLTLFLGQQPPTLQ